MNTCLNCKQEIVNTGIRGSGKPNWIHTTSTECAKPELGLQIIPMKLEDLFGVYIDPFQVQVPCHMLRTSTEYSIQVWQWLNRELASA
jgi:hypothetical protein